MKDDNEKFLKYVLEELVKIRDYMLSDSCSRDQTYKACYHLGFLIATLDMNLQDDEEEEDV